MMKTHLEHFCHMIHVIGESSSDKCRVATRENSERFDRRSIDTLWRGVHFRSWKRHRACLTSGETKSRIHMMDKENISIVSNGMDQMIDSLTECRTISCVSNDRHLRMSDFDTSCQWQNTSMKSMNRRQADFV